MYSFTKKKFYYKNLILTKNASGYPFEYQLLFRKFFSFLTVIQNLKDFLIFYKGYECKNKFFVCLYRETISISKFLEKINIYFFHSKKKNEGFSLFRTEYIFAVNIMKKKIFCFLFFCKKYQQKKKNLGAILRKNMYDCGDFVFTFFIRFFLKYLTIFTIFKVQFWICGISMSGFDGHFFILPSDHKKKNQNKLIIKKKKIPFFISTIHAKKIFILGFWIKERQENNIKNIFFLSFKKWCVSFFSECWSFFIFGLFDKKKIIKFNGKANNQKKSNRLNLQYVKKIFRFLQKKKSYEKIEFSPFMKIQKFFLTFYEKCSIIFWETEKLETKFLRKFKIFKIKNDCHTINFLRFIFWIQKKFLVFVFIIKKYFSCKFFKKEYFFVTLQLKKKKKMFLKINDAKQNLCSLKKKFFFSLKNKNLCVLFLELFPSINIFNFFMKHHNKQKTFFGKPMKDRFSNFLYNGPVENIKKIFLKIYLVNKKFEFQFINFICTIHESYLLVGFFSFFSRYHF